MNKIKLALSLFLLVGITACTKSAGEGGSSSITGKVYIKNYNSAGTLIEEYYAAEEDVYIIYGDESSTYNDDFKTSFDGSYKFDFLAKGTYTVFGYSDCATCDGGVEVVKQQVTINDNKKEFTLPDLVLNR